VGSLNVEEILLSILNSRILSLFALSMSNTSDPLGDETWDCFLSFTRDKYNQRQKNFWPLSSVQSSLAIYNCSELFFSLPNFDQYKSTSYLTEQLKKKRKMASKTCLPLRPHIQCFKLWTFIHFVKSCNCRGFGCHTTAKSSFSPVLSPAVQKKWSSNLIPFVMTNHISITELFISRVKTELLPVK